MKTAKLGRLVDTEARSYQFVPRPLKIGMKQIRSVQTLKTAPLGCCIWVREELSSPITEEDRCESRFTCKREIRLQLYIMLFRKELENKAEWELGAY